MDTVVVYAGEEPPASWHASMFIAGPMPRDPALPSWRPETLQLLADGWRGDGVLVVFVPEPRDRHHPPEGYVSQVWEERWMAVVDVILFWVPRNMQNLPGLNTNLEFGRNEANGRVVLGLPPEAVSVHYLRRAAETHGAPVRDTLAGTVAAALDLIGDGALRAGADRDVPLLIWRTTAFATWRQQLKGDLIAVRVLWVWRPSPASAWQSWAARVEILRDDAGVLELLIAHPGSSEVLADGVQVAS
jgi:hypothetical protein